MDPSAILLATVRFVCWEGALFWAALAIARAVGFRDEEQWLGALAIEITLESSMAAGPNCPRPPQPAGGCRQPWPRSPRR
jgi:hypothetical protein